MAETHEALANNLKVAIEQIVLATLAAAKADVAGPDRLVLVEITDRLDEIEDSLSNKLDSDDAFDEYAIKDLVDERLSETSTDTEDLSDRLDEIESRLDNATLDI